jgi:dolichol-phosphate mannosyltransferase
MQFRDEYDRARDQLPQFELSVVVPVFNEEDCLSEFAQRITNVLNETDSINFWEVIFVDDGSTDSSFQVIQHICEKDQRFRCIRFTRNFGHQSAIITGIKSAQGECIVTIDSDLQDPPELIPELLAKSSPDIAVVNAVRTTRAGETRIKRALAFIFYRVFKKSVNFQTEVDSGDYRLITRQVQQALLTVSESDQYLRGQIAWLGFPTTLVPYRRNPRYAGFTKYPLRKQLKLAVDALVSLSGLPLKIVSVLALINTLVLVSCSLWVLLSAFKTNSSMNSARVFVVVLFALAIISLANAVNAVYIGRLSFQARRKPSAIVRSTVNFNKEIDQKRSG